MGGGLMQLVAYGAQDIYLTGNPQITFFKVVYRRHTNFSMESIEQTFNGSPDFGKKVTVTVSRNGDLITKVYLQTDIPDVTAGASGFAWVEELGHFLVKSVEVEIGGQRIDKHYGTWLSIWSSLTLPSGKTDGYNNMIGNTSDMYNHSTSGTHSGKRLYVPLQFWFCRNAGLALPLIALQYHEVKFNIEFAAYADLVDSVYNDTNDSPALANTSLWIDYVYLDTDERRRFAQTSHEYLIEQLQFTGDESLSGVNNKVKLNFNHPVKELVWVVQSDEVTGNNFTDAVSETAEEPAVSSPSAGAYASGANPCDEAKLQLNGHDRFATRKGRYFNLVQPYQHHSNVPATGVNCYSFALKPEEHQPSGSANLSRIDNATLTLKLTAAAAANTNPVVKVYAVNYNVLRIMSGIKFLILQYLWLYYTSCASELICY